MKQVLRLGAVNLLKETDAGQCQPESTERENSFSAGSEFASCHLCELAPLYYSIFLLATSSILLDDLFLSALKLYDVFKSEGTVDSHVVNK